MKFKGIKFPYESDLSGKFLKLNSIDKDEVKSKISFLMTTERGERLYKPDFGVNIRQFLFDVIDDETINAVKTEITNAITKYINGVKIESVKVNVDEQSHFLGLYVSYSISDGFFKETDEISLLF
jgi:phage baseplate assembly protein W